MRIFKNKSGFALFESAVALAVAGSLFVSYQDQQINKQVVSEVLNYSTSSQQAVSQYYEKYGTLPTNNHQANLPESDRFEHPAISNLKIGEFGEIIITLQGNNEKNTANIANKTIILEPNIQNNTISWSCDDGSLDNKYRPRNCYKESEEIINIKEESDMYDFLSDENYL